MTRPLCRSAALLSAALTAAALAATPEPLLEPWRWARFDAADGLTAMPVLALAESPDGTVWAGTAGGLVRYDGFEWTAVDLEEGGPVAAVAVDDEGLVHVLAGRRLFVGRGERFEPRDLGRFLPASMAAAGEVVIIAGRYPDEGTPARTMAGYLVLKGGRAAGSPQPIGMPREIGHAGLLPAGTGRPWLDSGHGLARWDGRRFMPVAPFRNVAMRVQALDENAHGAGLAAVWFPPRLAGLWEWQAGAAPRRSAGEGHGTLAAAAVSDAGVAVAVYDSGDVRVRRKGRWRSVEPAPEPLRHAQRLRFRPNGDLWVVTTDALYLFRATLSRWIRWRHGFPDVRRDRIHEIARAADGTLWIASAGGVEARLPDGRLLPVPPLPDGDPVSVTTVAIDTSGRIWAGSGDGFTGLRVLENGRWRVVERDRTGAPLGVIHAIRRDREGRLWFLAIARDLSSAHRHEGAIFRLGPEGIERWGRSGSLAGDRPYDLAVDGEGAIWIATGGGLIRERAGRIERWTAQEGLPAPRVLSLAPRRGCGVAALTSGGSVVLAGSGVELTPIGPELPGTPSGPGSLAYDEAGRLWLAIADQLWVRRDGAWLRIDEAAGLDAGPLWPLLPAGGQLYIGALGTGLWRLAIGAEPEPPPRVRIAPPLVGDARTVVRWRPRPHMGERPPEKVPTRHRLDGGPWSAWSARHDFVLEDLAPGRYRVEVQAAGLLGSPGPAAAVTVPVRVPFYRTPEFLLPLALLAGTLLLMTVLFLRQHRRDAASLRASERRYRQLMEEASDAIFITDRRLFVESANRSAERMLRRSPGEVTGLSLLALAAGRDTETLAAALTELEPGRPRLLEIDLERGDGGKVRVELSLAEMPGGHLQAIARDITERRRLEEERLRFERRLAETQKLESLGVLAGGVAHDFNNLLTTILGNAEIALVEIGREAPAAAYVENVRRTARRAADLTRQLLDYAGGSPLVTAPIDLNDLALDMVSLLRTTIGKNVQLRCELDERVPSAAADPGRVRQVLLNLVVNASEAIGDRPGRILIATRWLPPGDDETGPGQVELAVEDDGPGVDPALRERIFEPFFTTKFSGRGLGLAAVKGIVEAHGGAVRVESGRNGGARFTVRLPAAAQAALPASGPPAPELAPDPAGGTVLVVDDEEDVLAVSAEVLSRSGYDVLAASSGDEALRLAAESGRSLRGAVIDLTMPGMDGAELVVRLRERHRSLPCVLISGWREREVARRLDRLPGVAFVQKPFDAATLQRSLGRVIAGG